MGSILWRMKDTAQQYVEILQEILGIDVSIVDDQQIRIAGSGRMKGRRGSVASYGNIMKHAIESRRITIVKDAITDPLCNGCPSKDRCDNLSEMWAPILMEGRSIGVIGCVCYNQEQKKLFLERRAVFEQFFTQFSSLLESRARTMAEAERSQNVQALLEHVLGRAQIGVLILDSRGRVHDLNQTGRALLQINGTQHVSGCTLTAAEDASGKEYNFSFGGRTRRIVAQRYQVGMDPYDQMLLFGDADLRSDLSDGLLALPSNDLDRIIGQSQPVRTLKEKIRLIAPSTSNVLITGESGTGKELAARAIHGNSQRAGAPFVAVNCAALPENLLESELFGYTKGAFTGASPNGKEGLLEAAQGGTFFLDEVGDMPISIQVKLLRVLEQREITRLGSNTPVPLDVRFVFATNCDLEEMIEAGTFRRDLYYRINVVPLTLPPLRERQGDIRILAECFIRKFTVSLKRPCSGISEDFWAALEHYSWPGNIRELQNVIEYAVNLLPSSGVLRSELLRKHLSIEAPGPEPAGLESGDDWNLEHMEARMIQKCLAQHQNQKDGKRLAAAQLGIGLATLYRKMKRYGLSE